MCWQVQSGPVAPSLPPPPPPLTWPSHHATLPLFSTSPTILSDSNALYKCHYRSRDVSSRRNTTPRFIIIFGAGIRRPNIQLNVQEHMYHETVSLSKNGTHDIQSSALKRQWSNTVLSRHWVEKNHLSRRTVPPNSSDFLLLQQRMIPPFESLLSPSQLQPTIIY